jgi:hypothetical protein
VWPWCLKYRSNIITHRIHQVQCGQVHVWWSPEAQRYVDIGGHKNVHTMEWKQAPKSWVATNIWSLALVMLQYCITEETKDTAEWIVRGAWPIDGNPVLGLNLHDTYTGRKKKSASSGFSVRRGLLNRIRWMATSAANKWLLHRLSTSQFSLNCVGRSYT